MNHVMVDLETLSTTPGATITSIGACIFDPDTGKIGETFYRTIDLTTQNRHVAMDTVKWWLQQGDAATEEIFKEGTHLKVALREFTSFLPSNTIIWSNGATFDVVILENAFSSLGLPTPWNFWSVRDVRTIVDLCKGILDRGKIKLEGDAHNSLDDALYQADYVSKMWKIIKTATKLMKQGKINVQ